VFKFAGQAFNAEVEAFYNVVRAGPGSISTPGDWQFRFSLALLSLSSRDLDVTISLGSIKIQKNGSSGPLVLHWYARFLVKRR
jgi:hypothetical protein